ncbi:unnamed protein product [Arctia plantaginis]|uniref:Glutathione S-transferase n=1 Tax=Arctia plantaginis TaxID=874455 RepID=A0A8S1B0U4_ARCPL|nr:unnamed protein product [Arctia plantaginis]CAB3251358.1 unnamed protein product [Arctia plantaginis]
MKRCNMSIDLYYTAGSAPCRLVLLVAAALDIQFNLKPLNLREGDQLKPDFLKLNPQHTVPTINDDGFVLDLKQRAIVDQRLDFDLGTLYPRFAKYFYPQVFADAPQDPAAFKLLEDALGFFDAFLEGHKYSAGDQLTLADLSLVATVSTIELTEVKLENYPNIVKWYELVKSTAPGYKEANEKGIDEFKQFLAQKKAKSEL